MRSFRLPIILSFTLFTALVMACQGDGQASCPVTQPNGVAPPGEEPSELHHGNGEIFTALWPDGVIVLDQLGTEARDEFGNWQIKFPWWRGEGVAGELEVAAEYLDGEDGVFSAIIPEGYGRTGFQASGLRFNKAGCWRVTGQAGDSELSFVVLLKEGE